MNPKKTLFLTTAMAGMMLVGTHSASAADFDGLYAGLSFGYEDIDFKLDTNNPGNSTAKGKGYYGLKAGYRLQAVDLVVVGLEANIGFHSAKNPLTSDTGDAIQNFTQKASGPISFNALAGFLITDDTLLFGTAGYSRVKTALLDDAGIEQLISKNEGGYELGVGVEHKIFGGLGLSLTGTYFDAGGHSAFGDTSIVPGLKTSGMRILFGAVLNF